MNKITRSFRIMKLLAIILLVLVGITGVVLTNINIDQHTKLVEREKIVQKNWIKFSLEKDNKSLQIIQSQAKRVETLENRLDNANIIMQNTTLELELRERLLTSTAKQLQGVIDALAVTKTKLDTSYRTTKYLGLRVSSLADSLYKAKKRIKELKVELDSNNTNKSFLQGIHNLEDLL